ncbi:MgtC/SapB family protein [Solitalea sp. MAHUQ-68]|uniref:MgtC/SapB family protein n=1 Tax=Solitalea agri TaxID=2953739 RepID=A0A9X2F0N5_9SPHI|nr:MgtC/SapB family protein [Solitalea agri]MCO4292452.1 MgtC/SapB family protein [Solitalea agri]
MKTFIPSEYQLNYPELRILLAFLLGALIGTERQLRHKMAGMRTNALVSVGSALFVVVSVRILGDQSSAARVVAQIASGIGFLGAGVIMKDSFNITGLNTAATIWCSGAIGALCGMGFWYEAVVGSIFVLLSHLLLRPLGKKVVNKYSTYETGEHRYTLKVNCAITAEDRIRDQLLAYIDKFKMRIINLTLEYDKVKKESLISIEVLSYQANNSDIIKIMQQINDDNDVSLAFWEVEVDNR